MRARSVVLHLVVLAACSTFYVDGSSEQIAGTAARSIVYTSPTANVGALPGSDGSFVGVLDEVAFYDKALPIARLDAHHFSDEPLHRRISARASGDGAGRRRARGNGVHTAGETTRTASSLGSPAAIRAAAARAPRRP